MPILALALGFAKRGLGFLAKLSPAQLALLVVTLTAVCIHIADIHHIHRVERHDLATSRALGREKEAHAADIARWKAGQELAAKLNKATIARVTASQVAITKETTDDYEAQLARLRAAYAGRVRPPSVDKRTADGAGASQVPGSPRSADGEAVPLPDDYLTAAETELQLNSLIDWVRRQSKLDPNVKS